ncbi:MAG: sulfotransferase domain-containing protein [Leptolyngbya sp. SIO4C1]|nr:sulfotransferase domain-containing protein [Leptolyngbya sp. SIO4C1]
MLKKQLKPILKYPFPLTVREARAYVSSPKVLINSLPKSGTFLLRRLLSLLPQFAPRWSYHGLVAETPNLFDRLTNIQKGQYVSGHLYWSQALADVLETANISTLFIIRDPRDVVVSLTNYLTYRNKNHRLHSYFKQLGSDSERLMAAIVGIDACLLGDRREESIGEHVACFYPWLSEKRCCSVRFEDLIGYSGGGSSEKQLENVCAIVDYLGLDLPAARLKKISNRLFFQSSTTFRKGQIGDWQNHFSPAHKQAFKAVAGKALIQLGYEKDDSW